MCKQLDQRFADIYFKHKEIVYIREIGCSGYQLSLHNVIIINNSPNARLYYYSNWNNLSWYQSKSNSELLWNLWLLIKA